MQPSGSTQASGVPFENILNIWRRIILEVASGRTVEMQAVRPQLLAALEHRLDLLKRTTVLPSGSAIGRERNRSPTRILFCRKSRIWGG